MQTEIFGKYYELSLDRLMNKISPLKKTKNVFDLELKDSRIKRVSPVVEENFLR